MIQRRRSPGQERRSRVLLEVAPRGFEEFRPGEHHVDRRRQPSAERRLSKPRGATSGSIPARLISRAAMDDRKMNPSLPKHPHTPSIVRTIRIAYMYGAKLYHTYGVLTAGGTHRTIGHTRNRYETDTKAYRPTKPTTKPTKKKPVELSVCSICIFAVHVAAAVCSSSSGRYAVVLWDCPQVQGTSAKPT